MGRRSLHTADELRELIVQASTDLIHENGLAGLSAREIARRIDYSPGTLYNSFDNLDDLVLTIEGRMLDRLAEALDAVPPDGTANDRVYQMAACYLRFADENPRLWNLLFEHHVSAARVLPDWYRQKVQALGERFEDVLRPLADGLSAEEVRRSARILWSSVHGISSLAVADKLAIVSADEAAQLVRDLVGTYLKGLEARGAVSQ
jgi:AcrR family transcriptional regulator